MNFKNCNDYISRITITSSTVSSETPYCFDVSDYAIVTERGKKSKFDEKLRDVWAKRQEQNLFKYDYREIENKHVPGRFKFLAQLSILRAQNKREAQSVSSVTMPFDDTKFNFGNVESQEILFEVIPWHWLERECEYDVSMYRTVLLINVSPIGYCSSLLVPSIEKCIPQMLDLESLRIAVETILISHDPTLRVGMNSLGAYASVNHLHFHLYYLEETLYLQSAPVKKVSGRCYETVDYPAECFSFQVVKENHVLSVVRSVMKLLKWFQREEIAHNIFITRGTAFSDPICDKEEHFTAVRIYIWPRKSFFGSKSNAEFNPAVCELAGHLLIKDKRFFETVTEDKVIDILKDVCHDTFVKVRNDVFNLFS